MWCPRPKCGYSTLLERRPAFALKGDRCGVINRGVMNSKPLKASPRGSSDRRLGFERLLRPGMIGWCHICYEVRLALGNRHDGRIGHLCRRMRFL
jgi:hypothetical protein